MKAKFLKKVSYYHDELDPDMAFAKNLREQGVKIFLSNICKYGHLINTDSYDITRTRPEFFELLTNKFDWEKRYIDNKYFQQLIPETVPMQPCQDVRITK